MHAEGVRTAAKSEHVGSRGVLLHEVQGPEKPNPLFASTHKFLGRVTGYAAAQVVFGSNGCIALLHLLQVRGAADQTG